MTQRDCYDKYFMILIVHCWL